ncbi:MAG TPA: hypothetical protein VLE44_00305 [Candidatus Saccharimonadales bacterium]|nr:hypothetical protein [Candidatus Saccharimonadales bacterium]
MEIEKVEEKSIVKRGKNLQAFMDNQESIAIENGTDSQVSTLRALRKARNTGGLERLINSDIKNVSDTSASGK